MNTIPTATPNVTYRVSATVNGRMRRVAFSGPRDLSATQVINDLLENNEGNYRRFYQDATDADYAVDLFDLDDLSVEVYGWSEVQ